MVERDLYIIPECYVDTNVVETLLAVSGNFTDGVNHQKGCNQVVKVMKKYFSDDFAVGVIDNDKREVSYLEEFYLVCRTTHIKVLKHQEKHHYIFLIAPAMDEFILDAAKEINVCVDEYGFSSELSGFTEQTKQIAMKNDRRMKSLIKSIVNQKEMDSLGKALSYLKINKYNSEAEYLVKLFTINQNINK